MTVAVGIMSPTFLILAADSQEGWWDGQTRPVRKIDIGILQRREHRGRVAVTGAGGSDYLAYVKSRIIDQLEASPPRIGSFETDVEKLVETEMIDFYTKHFAPVAHLDAYRYLDPSVIIGVRFRDKAGLWSTFGSTVRRIHAGPAAVGTGAMWARSVLDRKYPTSEHAATLAACYAVFLAKERVESCGKETAIVSLREDANVVVADLGAVRAAETVFGNYNALQDEMLNALMAPPKSGIQIDTGERAAWMRNELSKINFYPQAAARN